jgi:hypothetical protein
MYEVVLSGAFFMTIGTHGGEFSEARVAHRITGRNQPGVGRGRRFGFIEIGPVGSFAIIDTH